MTRGGVFGGGESRRVAGYRLIWTVTAVAELTARSD
jgi:hypothetical protein